MGYELRRCRSTNRIEELSRRLAGKDAEIDRLRAALERLGSMEAFVMSRTTSPEERARIDFARETLNYERPQEKG